MPQTADSFFYSLESNALAPPPYSPALPGATPQVETITHDEKEGDTFTSSFVRRFTSPFLRGANSLPSQCDTSKTSSTWLKVTMRISDLVVNWWLWELGSWFISALCIFGIALLLGHYDGRTLPDRFPLDISLATQIAVLSNVTKFSLSIPLESSLGQAKWNWFAQEPRPLGDFEHFDNASRGPYGSALLIWRMKGRTIASLGAIVTILSLAMDPFFQQLIHLPRRAGTSNLSTVPRMVNFTLERNMWHNGTADLDIIGNDRNLENIVFSYMVNSGTKRDISAFCPSETCAWKPFDTLALFSECTDVSDMLTLACLEEAGDWRRNVTADDAEVPRSFSCGYFMNVTSDNPILMSGYALNTSATPAEPLEFLLMRNLNLHDVNIDTNYWGGSIKFGTPGFPLVDFVQVASQDTASILRGDPPMARECVIRWCTERISASHEQGVYSEEILSRSFDTGEIFDALEWTPELFTTYSKNFSITPPDSNLTFFVPNTTTLPTIFLLQEYFPSYLTVENATTTPILQTRNWRNFKPKFWPFSVNIFATSDGNEYIRNMTSTMTNTIRMYPHSSEEFLGSGAMETYIRVRWYFLALPLSLVIMTIMLLAAVIFENRRNQSAGVWKTSALASMVYGLDDQTRRKLTPTDRLSDVVVRATMRVRLSTDEEGSRLKLFVDNR